MKRYVLIAAVGIAAWTSGTAEVLAGDAAAPPLLELYPEIEPWEKGHLKVSDQHEIYYELCGNRNGKPVMLLHGGPGGGCFPAMRRFHDPSKYFIILHDQRGAGKSKPSAELRDNDTQALTADIERLRTHLKLGAVQIFGGSWGSTLGLAYAQAHPESVSELVLRGVFLATKDETDHFYHGGVRSFFPETFERLQSIMPEPKNLNYPKQLLSLLQSTDPAIRDKASLGWARYEMRLSAVGRTDEDVEKIFSQWNPFDFSLIENHYMANDCFLKEGQLLENVGKIANIPTTIVQGRWDMVCPMISAHRLHRALPKSKLVIVENAGHSASEPGVRSALIQATRSFE